MKIANRDTSKNVFTIAEIGNNHEGDFDVAIKMIDAAATTGVDAVKFQTFKAEHYVHLSQKERFERLKKFELSYDQFSKLAEHAKSKGLSFISTPFDLHSADFLTGICDALKISSSDNSFYPLVNKVAESGLPVLASTGIANFDEIDGLQEILKETQFALLHCVSAYPVAPEEANLQLITSFKSRYECCVGYSDHTLGSDAAFIATALGAQIIEKHFTLDKNWSDFRDHQLSATPDEMKELVERVKLAETLLGNGREFQESEAEARTALRRSIVACQDIAKGEVLNKDQITWVRPGGGIAPGNEHLVVGKELLKDLSQHDVINLEDLR